MSKIKSIVRISFLVFILFQFVGLLWSFYSLRGIEITEQESISIEAYSVYFIWSLVSIPIVLLARKWGRVQYWYWLATFWFYITPIILLVIKGKNKKRNDLDTLSFFHLETIINYLFINLVFIYFYTSAPVRGFPAYIGGASGIIVITIGYSIYRLINRSNSSIVQSQVDEVDS